MKFEEYRLGDLIESISVTHKFPRREIIFLNTSDILEGSVLTDEFKDVVGLPGQAKKSMKKGDILYSEIRPKNKRYAFIDFDAENYVVSTKLMVLRVKAPRLLNNKYLYYYLTCNNIVNHLQNLAESRSGTFPQITYSEIASLDIALPTLQTQNRVVDFMDDLNDKLKVNNAIIFKLEELAQTLFKHWFVDFEFPNEEGKPYKSSGGKMVESKLGMIPEKWELSTLGLFSNEMKNGGTPSRKNKSYWLNGKIPWLKTKEIKSNYIIEAEEFITQEGLEGSSAKLLSKDTILIAMYGATAGQLGFLKFEATTNQACCAVITDYPNYVYSFLIRNQEYIKSLSTGSAQQNLSKEILSNLKIVIPNYNILNKFEKNISFISSKIEALLKENRVLEALLDTLLPKLLSGEIELPDDMEVTDDVPIS